MTMGLLALPTMLRRGYDPAIATGTLAATGTLGQIIPPSIVLVLLGDVMSSAYQQAQLKMGIFSPKTVSVGDLFVGALLPGLLLVGLYIAYIIGVAIFQPKKLPALPQEELGPIEWGKLINALAPPLLLIGAVLGSILAGYATPTEAAALGALGAMLLAFYKGKLNFGQLREVAYGTTEISAMVFLILIGASLFSLVFRGFGGEAMIEDIFCSVAWRRARRVLPGNGGDLPARLYPRLYRDHLCGGADCRSGIAGHGPGPGMAGRDDRTEPADVLPDSAVRLCAVLPARGHPGLGTHQHHL